MIAHGFVSPIAAIAIKQFQFQCQSRKVRSTCREDAHCSFSLLDADHICVLISGYLFATPIRKSSKEQALFVARSDASPQRQTTSDCAARSECRSSSHACATASASRENLPASAIINWHRRALERKGVRPSWIGIILNGLHRWCAKAGSVGKWSA